MARGGGRCLGDAEGEGCNGSGRVEKFWGYFVGSGGFGGDGVGEEREERAEGGARGWVG